MNNDDIKNQGKQINNAIAKTNNTGKVKFSTAIQSDTYKNLINRTLGDKDRATRFVANISSAVAINPDLQECDAGTILSGALLGESLNLSPSPNLGQFYLVPFNDTKNKRKVAQFQIRVPTDTFSLQYVQVNTKS